VIDVLAKVRKSVVNRQLYEADYAALADLTKLANELGLAIVVVHHTRKMAADDLMEMVSGSYGVAGAVDTILVMATKASGTILDIRGRDVESAELARAAVSVEAMAAGARELLAPATDAQAGSLTPPPPAENATARQHQARQSRTAVGPGTGAATRHKLR
jgi:hypothetical protein